MDELTIERTDIVIHCPSVATASGGSTIGTPARTAWCGLRNLPTELRLAWTAD